MSEAKVSPVEAIKSESQFLRGEIPGELTDDSDAFGKSSVQLLKHHGTYQQEDRDARQAARAAGNAEKKHIFMVRTRIPGGRLTAEQLLAELDLCDELGTSTLRITSRQGLQLHGVIKSDLQATIRRINETQLTTLGACGDVNRNVMCCPAPLATAAHAAVQQLAQRLAEHFAPRTPSYHELWLTDVATGEKQLAGGDDGAEVEPIYGSTYLPRKFKMGVGFPSDNCVDVYTHDLGLLAVVRDGQVVGYNVLVGGGQGVTPAVKKTFPALAQPMAFVTSEQVVAVAEAVVKVQRDHGNRADRKVARLKYLVHEWGVAKFRAAVEEYSGLSLEDCQPLRAEDIDDHMGWHEQGDGRWFYGLNIENGRIKDDDTMRLKTALRELCRELRPGIRLTSHQGLLLTDLSAAAKEEVPRILRSHDVPLTEDISTARQWSMACVAWPTCGLSITESERALPGVMDELDVELQRLGLQDERFTVRMTGCPNGCARPYNCDIGLVGKGKDKYTLLVGGRPQGDRLNFIYQDLVPRDEIVPRLTALLAYFQESREGAESFGDFCTRKGVDDLLSRCAEVQPEA